LIYRTVTVKDRRVDLLRKAGTIIGRRIAHKKSRPLKNAQFCSRSKKTKTLATGIYLIFRRLKFESDAEIGQKGEIDGTKTGYHLDSGQTCFGSGSFYSTKIISNSPLISDQGPYKYDWGFIMDFRN
jgi:hypothetical protein